MLFLFLLHVCLIVIFLLCQGKWDNENNCFMKGDYCFLVFLPFLGLYFLLYYFFSFNIWFKKETTAYPVIKYKSFYDYFLLNPERWSIPSKSYMSTIMDDNCFVYSQYDKSNRSSNNFIISLNRRDYKKAHELYQEYQENKVSLENEKRKKKTYIDFLKCIQEDINTIQKQSEEDIKKASVKSDEIINRINTANKKNNCKENRLLENMRL